MAYAGRGTRIRLHFSLSLESGEIIDSTFGKSPGELDFGDGTLPPGFEEVIHGMAAGEAKTVAVPPEKAFGMPNPSNIQYFPRSSFSPDLPLEVGAVINFADASRSELPGIVRSSDKEEVVVDFNHPLAGRPLVFQVEVLDVQVITIMEEY